MKLNEENNTQSLLILLCFLIRGLHGLGSCELPYCGSVIISHDSTSNMD